jgi:hypothetical protein
MANPTVKKTIRIATIAGSAALVVGAGMSILSAKNLKEGIMPGVAILVGIAAFNYAMNDKEVVKIKE